MAFSNYIPIFPVLHHATYTPTCFPPSTVHCTFLQVNLSWVMKSNLLSLGALLLTPISMVFFLLKNGGIFFNPFNLCFHTHSRFLSSSSSFPLHCSHCFGTGHHSLTTCLSAHWRGLLSLADNYLGSGETLGYVTLWGWQHPMPQLVGISSPAGCLCCDSSTAMLCFPALPCFMGASQDPCSAITNKSRMKFKKIWGKFSK